MTEPAQLPRSSNQEPDAIKLPPQAMEAEQSLLGGLMLDNARLDEVADLVTAADFYHRNHKLIFEAVTTLCSVGDPADVVTVSEWLEKNGYLESIGGLAYVGSLARNTPTTANLVAYARIVRDRSILRGLIQGSHNIAARAFNPEGRSPGEVLDYAEKTIFDIAQHDATRGGQFTPLKNLMTQSMERIEELFASGGDLTGIATGFEDLDSHTAGLQSSDLIIIAGRPSMGKTALAMNIAEAAALKQNIPVAIFSMEMPGQQLATRMLASLSRINAQKLRTGKLHDDDWPRLTSTLSILADKPIFVDDTPSLTPLELRTRARRLAREQGLGLIIVDYLQLMQAAESTENRATEISNITRSLKILSKELNVPLIALSQLNRSLEQRPNKRPVMSDLRESGAIEQDADVILFIYRDEVYNEDSQDKGTAEIIIGKQRNGPVGTVRLTFLGEYTRFENYANVSYEGIYG
ncbi:MAG: replicative DNA helicase [Gammaproteobacteria bacterium]|nr:replicative DNA helicase [Gammaproteobacteria bacterium]